MTKKEALEEFKRIFPDSLWTRMDSKGRKYLDKPMRDETWNNFTDTLCKERRITLKQYETWTHPFN